MRGGGEKGGKIVQPPSVNRLVVGSNPTRGANIFNDLDGALFVGNLLGTARGQQMENFIPIHEREKSASPEDFGLIFSAR